MKVYFLVYCVNDLFEITSTGPDKHDYCRDRIPDVFCRKLYRMQLLAQVSGFMYGQICILINKITCDCTFYS